MPKEFLDTFLSPQSYHKLGANKSNLYIIRAVQAGISVIAAPRRRYKALTMSIILNPFKLVLVVASLLYLSTRVSSAALGSREFEGGGACESFQYTVETYWLTPSIMKAPTLMFQTARLVSPALTTASKRSILVSYLVCS